MNEKEFKPYIPADKVIPEFTVFSVILGCLLAIIFGGANAYLGLRVGMTVSASIPAAVISMGLIRVIFKRDSILENNMVQTIGSAGESLAAGAIFTMPALFMWAAEGKGITPNFLQITILAVCGGVLGTLMMIPLRRALIVEEHGVLKYPEGTACAEVLMAGEKGGAKASTVFAGLGIAAGYKFIVDGLKLFPYEVDYAIKPYKGAGIGIDVLPALAGVGYICGPRVSSYMFGGSVLAWLGLMPLIMLFGANATVFPVVEMTIGQLWALPAKDGGGVWGIWSNYIKYIGAGALAAGGIISLIKSMPMIIKTFAKAFSQYGKGEAGTLRTDTDISMRVVLLTCLGIILFLWLFPWVEINWLGAILILLFGFFFSTVSSRMVGLIGSSNNPVSGMAIATLLITTVLLKATGYIGTVGMLTAISVGSVICIIAAIAGDTSQDLKSGYILGASPKKQQIGQLIGTAVAAAAIGAILWLLNRAWGFGTKELGAPQASMMKMIVEGVMDGNLPWALIFIGVFIAVVIEILGLPVLPVAIGIYLPIHLNAAIMMGGLVRLFMDKRKYANDAEKEECIQSGVLYTSGLIAGEGLVGILLAVFAIITVGQTVNEAGEVVSVSLGDAIDLSEKFSFGNIGSLVIFAGLLFSIYYFANRGKKSMTQGKKTEQVSEEA